MNKRKLIILESADNLGKSTLSKLLASKLDATIMQQPSSDNSLSFLRKIVKEDRSIEPFPRQLLHTISHTVDLYEKMQVGSGDIIMDRCYISALIYGKLTNLSLPELELIQNIHSHLYAQLEHSFDVHIFILTRNKPFACKDNSIYEKTLDWDDINDEYCSLVKTNAKSYFTSNETIELLIINEYKDIEDILKHIRCSIKV